MKNVMGDTVKDASTTRARDRRGRMVNERTFLAWIRTSISIMAFGFVVEKFSLFVKQLSYYLGKEASPPTPGYSPVVGIILVGLGAVMGVLAYIRYRSVERQIKNDNYASLPIMNVLFMLSVIAVGLFLVLYLIHALQKALITGTTFSPRTLAPGEAQQL